jgi:hypothetical protein
MGRRLLRKVFQQLAEIDQGKRVHQCCNALMDRALGQQGGQGRGIRALDRSASEPREVLGFGLDREQAADKPAWICDGRSYGVVTIYPEATADGRAGAGRGVGGETLLSEALARRHDRP